MNDTSNISSGGHTPGPWSLLADEDGAFQIAVPGKVICSRAPWPHNREQSDANAKLIVTACNSHPDLLAALEAAREFVENELEVRESSHGGDDTDYVPEARDCLAQIDAALIKGRAGV